MKRGGEAGVPCSVRYGSGAFPPVQHTVSSRVFSRSMEIPAWRAKCSSNLLNQQMLTVAETPEMFGRKKMGLLQLYGFLFWGGWNNRAGIYSGCCERRNLLVLERDGEQHWDSVKDGEWPVFSQWHTQRWFSKLVAREMRYLAANSSFTWSLNPLRNIPWSDSSFHPESVVRTSTDLHSSALVHETFWVGVRSGGLSVQAGWAGLDGFQVQAEWDAWRDSPPDDRSVWLKQIEIGGSP